LLDKSFEIKGQVYAASKFILIVKNDLPNANVSEALQEEKY
jgi:hypothetical protein